MKISLFAFLLLSGLSLQAQTRTELTGRWKILRVDYPNGMDFDGEEGEKLLRVIEVLESSSFELLDNGEVDYDFRFEDLEIRGGFWHFYETSKRMTVSGKDEYGTEKGRLFRLQIQKAEARDQWLFRIERTPFTLVAERSFF